MDLEQVAMRLDVRRNQWKFQLQDLALKRFVLEEQIIEKVGDMMREHQKITDQIREHYGAIAEDSDLKQEIEKEMQVSGELHSILDDIKAKEQDIKAVAREMGKK